jgi:hypothetical protein
MAGVVRVEIEGDVELRILPNGEIFNRAVTVPKQTQNTPLGLLSFEVCYFLEIEKIVHERLSRLSSR